MSGPLKQITKCMGYEQIASGLDAANSLDVPVIDAEGNRMRPTMAIIIPETQAVRWRDDGTDPTGSIGMPLAVGVSLIYDGDLTKIRFIEQAASAKLNISYFA